MLGFWGALLATLGLSMPTTGGAGPLTTGHGGFDCMSGALSFISTNPAMDAFDRTDNSIARQRQREWADQDRRDARAVDRAIRGGLSEVSTGSGFAPAPGSNRPTSGAANPPMQANDRDAFGAALASIEDPTGTAINPSGHIGRYQFSTGALHGAGVYQPAPGENMRANEWRGTIVLPGGRRLTRDQFLADRQAQEEAFTRHVANLDREIAARGLDRYVGTRVMDQPVTRSGLYAMMHMGGPEGTTRFLRSGGIADPADANGMRISTYSQEVLKRMGLAGVAPPAAAGQAAPGNPYAPVISRLTTVPGGGRVGLDLVARGDADTERRQAMADRRFEADRNFDQRRVEADRARNDRYQMMAMQAFARGDADVGRYWAEQGGFRIPDQLANDAQAMRRFGVATTMGRSIYGEDRPGAARFVREFMTNGGNAAAALDAAGDPSGGGRGVIQWREADRAIRLRMLIAAGFSEQDANAIAAGAVPSANAMVSAYSRVARMAADDFSLRDDTQRQARIQQTMDAMFGPGWQERMRGAPGASRQMPLPPAPPDQPPPAPSAAPPAAAPRPVIQMRRPPNVPAGSQFNERLRLWRDPTERLYNEDGSLAQ